MAKINKALFYLPTVLLALVACHHSSLDSRATIALANQPQQIVTKIPSAPKVKETPALGVEQPDTVVLSTVIPDASSPITAVPDTVNLPLPTVRYDSPMAAKLDSLMTDPFLQKTQMGFYVYDLTDDRPVFAYGHQQSMRPASTMKVITSVTALTQLGTNYTYQTQLYHTGKLQKNVLSGALYVKGGFDPLTGNETVNEFVAAIAKMGIHRVSGDLILDLSMKDDKEAGWGWCWDDRNPSLTPLLYKEKPFFGEALQQALLKRGIRITGVIKQGRIPRGAQLICTHQTHIDKALKPMMKMSVNQVAESMFYQIGAQQHKPYATHHTAAAFIKQFIRENLNLIPDHYRIADGSGLSPYNYITPELLVQTLRYAYQHQDIYRHLLPALPIAGEDGTLKNRMRYTSAHGKIRAKTGTLTGICSLAGYTTTKNGHRICFAIINQGQMKGAEARDFQDKLCLVMTQIPV